MTSLPEFRCEIWGRVTEPLVCSENRAFAETPAIHFDIPPVQRAEP
jgi:hypothetical protein